MLCFPVRPQHRSESSRISFFLYFNSGEFLKEVSFVIWTLSNLKRKKKVSHFSHFLPLDCFFLFVFNFCFRSHEASLWHHRWGINWHVTRPCGGHLTTCVCITSAGSLSWCRVNTSTLVWTWSFNKWECHQIPLKLPSAARMLCTQTRRLFYLKK